MVINSFLLRNKSKGMVDIFEIRNLIIKFEICNFVGKDYLLIKVWCF